MARPKKATVLQVELPDANETETETETEEQKESEAILAEVRSEQPRHPIEIVHRLDDDTGEEGWVGKFAASAVTPEFLAKRFGPGKYRCYMRKPGKNGHMGFGGSRTVTVVADLRPTVSRGEPPMAGEGGRGGTLGETLLISMMRQQSESSQHSMQMMQGLFTALTGAFSALKPTAPTTDPMMLAVIQGMMARKDPTEIAGELMRSMRENGGTAKDPIEQLKQLLEVKELLGGSGGDTDPETSMILKGMETLQQLFAGGRAFQPPPNVARPVAPGAPVAPSAEPSHAALPAPRPTPPQSPESAPPMAIDPNMRPWKQGVASSLPMLLQAAAFMPPHAAALTAKEQMQAAGVWADLTEDVRTDYPALDLDTLPDDFGTAFVDRTVQELKLETLPGDTFDWVRETLYELAVLAVEPEEKEGGEVS